MCEIKIAKPVPIVCDFTHFKPPLNGGTLDATGGSLVSDYANTPACSYNFCYRLCCAELPADHERLFNGLVNTLHALFWSAED
jgi:hypothetical protein